MYGAKIRLTPTIAREQYSHKKEKMMICQTQHRHNWARLTTEYNKGIELLGFPCKNSVLIISQMVMAQLSKDGTNLLLVSVDRNTHRENNTNEKRRRFPHGAMI